MFVQAQVVYDGEADAFKTLHFSSKVTSPAHVQGLVERQVLVPVSRWFLEQEKWIAQVVAGKLVDNPTLLDITNCFPESESLHILQRCCHGLIQENCLSKRAKSALMQALFARFEPFS